MKFFKKITAVFLAGSMLFNTAYAAEKSFTATDAVRAYKGVKDLSLDVNGDGKVDSKDAELILKKVLNDDYSFDKEASTVTTTEKATETTTKSSSTDDDKESSTATTTEKATETTTKSSSTDDDKESSTVTTTEKATEATTEVSTEEPSETTTVDASYNKTWNFSEWTVETISETKNVDGLEVGATSGASMAVRARKRKLGEKNYTNSLNLSGSGNISKRYVALDVKGNTKLTIVAESAGSDTRTLEIADNAKNVLGTADIPTKTSNNEPTKIVINLNYTGKIYIYSENKGIDLYEIIRESDGGSSSEESSTTTTEATTEATTEKTTEATTEKSTEASTEATTSGSSSEKDLSQYGVQGFAIGLKDLDTSGYTKYTVSNETDFMTAINKANNGTKAIIEVTADLNLGYNEVTGASEINNFEEYNPPLLHPTLLDSGVSKIGIKATKGLIIYSPNGNKIKHTAFVLNKAQNVIIRNLTFCELWEWDEYSFGHYDRNDWDYICIQGASKNIWIDHCTFSKAYDGVVDSKAGSNGLSITWCNFDSEIDRDFIKAQIDYLEEHIDDATATIKLTNGTGSAIDSLGLTADTTEQTTLYNNALYRYLRKEVGLTTDEIIYACMPQQKSHLIGSSDTESNRENLEVTLAYNYYNDSRDRIPRLRSGNAHIYNCVIDSTDMNKVYNEHKAALMKVAKITWVTGKDKDGKDITEKWDFSSTNQAFVTTRGGAMSAENCVIKDKTSPVKNNQKSATATDYTGKFRGLNMLVDGVLTTWDGTQDAIDNDKDNKLYPLGANDPIVFSWNSTPNFSNEAITYTAIDPTNLETELKGKVGAGAVDLDWTKTTY